MGGNAGVLSARLGVGEGLFRATPNKLGTSGSGRRM
jgi:hypothetical protein